MSGYDEALLKRARALHDAPNVTMDGHNDLPWALHDAYDHRLAKFDLREPQGHIKIPKLRHQYLHTDFPRCRKGGLTAQFWSVYVPTTIRGGEAVQKTLEQIDCVHRLCEKYPDHLEFAYTAADVAAGGTFADGLACADICPSILLSRLLFSRRAASIASRPPSCPARRPPGRAAPYSGQLSRRCAASKNIHS